MCYESLIDGDAREKTLGELLRAELGSAVTDGAIAATVILVVALLGGVGVQLAVAGTVSGFVFGVLLHQCVLVVGVWVVRWRARAERSGPDPV